MLATQPLGISGKAKEFNMTHKTFSYDELTELAKREGLDDLAAQAHEESLEMQKAEEEAEIAFGKAEAEMEGFMNSPEFDNLDDYRAWKQADDEEKRYQDWKAEAMKKQEYELDDDRYRAEYAFAKSVEQEALVRSNEFDVGRDVDPEAEVEGEVEQFHDNLVCVIANQFDD